mgnify:CR=1 FL=1
MGRPIPKNTKPADHRRGHRQRLRNRLDRAGIQSLADYEVLELVLGLALRRGDVKQIAKDLLVHCGGFAGVIAARDEELTTTENVGPSETHGGRPNSWLYYTLYALERVGMLYDTKKVGPHDWYFEGAKVILDAQKPDGCWNDSNQGRKDSERRAAH